MIPEWAKNEQLFCDAWKVPGVRVVVGGCGATYKTTSGEDYLLENGVGYVVAPRADGELVIQVPLEGFDNYTEAREWAERVLAMPTSAELEFRESISENLPGWRPLGLDESLAPTLEKHIDPIGPHWWITRLQRGGVKSAYRGEVGSVAARWRQRGVPCEVRELRVGGRFRWFCLTADYAGTTVVLVLDEQ